MTNGEKIKEVFPKANIKMPTIFETKVKVFIDLDCEVKFPVEWWDEEYKKPTKSCSTCRSYKGHAGHCDICHNMSMYKKVEPTTKNDLPHCHHTDEEIAKSFIEDVEAVKDLLPTTKNNLGVDCISKEAALDCVNWGYSFSDIYKKINELPSVTPIRPKGHWINKQRLLDSCSAECSACHNRSNGYMHDNGFSLECKYYDFCPKCGSNNREVEE